MSDTPLFSRLGGAAGIAQLVGTFYGIMNERPEFAALRALHASDLSDTSADLKTYLAEWTGGPANYSAAKGHPRLRRRHMHVKIGEAERDDWMRCMALALNAAVADEDARALLRANFAKLADWMRNQPGNAHDAGQSFGGPAAHEPAPADCVHAANHGCADAQG